MNFVSMSPPRSWASARSAARSARRQAREAATAAVGARRATSGAAPAADDSARRSASSLAAVEQLRAQMETAGLGESMRQGNMWHSVDDFKWHRAQHSPNWCVLPESERLAASPSELVTMGEFGKEAEEREEAEEEVEVEEEAEVV